MAPSGLSESFLGAIQASVSVLLVIFYGGIAAKLGILDSKSSKAISKICVRMFLPALLVTKLGSEIHAGSAGRYGTIVVWAILCHMVSFLIGIFGHFVCKMPDWVTVAVMFNNTTSYPLLLIGALAETGILSSLIVTDETTKDAIERAKSYFLVFSTISSCLTFAVGPRLIDSEHAADSEEVSDVEEDGEAVGGDGRANEETGLLGGHAQFLNPFTENRSFFPSSRKPSAGQRNGDASGAKAAADRRASLIPRTRWQRLNPRVKWWLLFISDFFNAPLVGALIGAVIGLIPALHKAFFNDSQNGGIFTAWLTSSLSNIGGLFVPLPVVVAGVSLYTSYKEAKESKHGQTKLPWGTVSYVMIVRFVLWPIASIGVIYLLASRTEVLGDDPVMWFTMMLMPTGPPAMKLITLVQVSDAGDEEEAIIAKLLTVSTKSSWEI